MLTKFISNIFVISNKIMIKLIVGLLFFTVTANLSLFGQNQTQLIRGTIIDEDTQIPLLGATVSTVNIEPLIGTISDAEGVFRLENIPIGRVDLVISYIGYQDKFISSIELNSAKEIILDIALVESVETLQEVVVTTSTKKGEALNDLAIVSSRSFSGADLSLCRWV